MGKLLGVGRAHRLKVSDASRSIDVGAEMNPLRRAPVRCLFVAGVAAVLAACASTGDDATATLSRSAQAMGSTGLKTLRYAGTGTGFTFGQAYTPRRRLAEDHRALDDADDRLRQRLDARRDRPQPRRAAGRRWLSDLGRTAQRPVHQRRDRLEPDRHDGHPRPPLRHRSNPPALDHPARGAEGGAAQPGDGAPQRRRRDHRVVQPARPL